MYYDFQKPKRETIMYKDLHIGDMFFFANGCYIKLMGDDSLNIYNDSIGTFSDEIEVELVDYKITIYSEE